ncbi:vitamin K epoxide reductase family protein [Chloroflexus sp.]|uniref:vitamin K epoxide reductase family protein n=1 Tax=Chloroflexus sp. TaxID=1904827 RepID=UPI00258F4514|nr:vitamin K epoxide reductase family protein [Chloroflexus sp.]
MTGTLFSLYLTFLEPFVIGATCIWCLLSAITMTSAALGESRLLCRSTLPVVAGHYPHHRAPYRAGACQIVVVKTQRIVSLRLPLPPLPLHAVSPPFGERW